MSKENKAALKAAREAIRAKDYKEAIKQCKGILKQDKGNYNALVFVGVAAEGLEQPDQAIAAYKKAIDVDDTQPLAWQGLCGFYEKANKDEYKPDLLQAYEKLANLLESDIGRRFEIEVKLALLFKECGHFDKAVDTLKQSLEVVTKDEEKSKQVWNHLATLLSEQKDLSEEHKSLLERAYDRLVHTEDGSEPAPSDLWTKYIQLLNKNGAGRVRLREECEQMVKASPTDLFPLNLLCQIELDTFVETGESTAVEALEQRVAALAEVHGKSVYVSLSPACVLVKQGVYNQALEPLKSGSKSERSLVAVWVLLAKVQSRLHDNVGVSTSVTRALKLLSDPEARWTGEKQTVERCLKIMQAKAKIELGTPTGLTAAIETLLKVTPSDPEVMVSLGEAYLAQGNMEKVTEILSDLKKAGDKEGSCMLKGWYEFHCGDLPAAEENLSAVTEVTGRLLYRRGRLYSARAVADKDYREKCFTALLHAAKLEPYYSPTFYYLGLYYQEVVKDNARARRCYQKAYDLNGENEEAGSALVDRLTADGEEEAAIALLLGVTQKASAGSAKWAWLRLGLNQQRVGDHTAAITSLQSALRADSKDSHVWECLGEAYMGRGSFTAALKAFTRATELNEDAMYCFYQAASIQQLLGAYTEAVKQYEQILEKSPDYVPALKGAGQTLILQAQAALTKFSHGRAVDYCQQAVQYLTRAAIQRSDLSCLWKLLGDACTILHPVDSSKLKMNVPSRLLSADTKGDDTTSVNRQQLLALGGRCYSMALRQVADCASLWHDLGVNSFLQGRSFGDADRKPLVARATQCLQKAVTLAPDNYRHWLALGVIATSDDLDNPALAQHCFIKSIKAEPNNVAAWTGLGTLYLADNQVELAHEAYKMAQSLEPLYVGAWIGQALVAEAVGHDDAMDLFRHTTELANHTEGALGYAGWVVGMLADKVKVKAEVFSYTIEQMAAVPAASDALARYTDRVKTNALAFNLHGLLLEKQELTKQATEAFRNAVSLLDKGPADQLRDARSNYARLLCTSGQGSESVKMYESCSKPLSFEETCGLALALYKADEYQDSMKAYEKALTMAPGAADQSHVQAALGLVAYKAGDPQAAKTLLFKCSQVSPPSVPGLLALCSVGLLEADLTLASAVLQEVDKLGYIEQHSASVLYLTAQVMAAQGNVATGLAYIQRELHRRPANAPYWQTLAQYLLQHSPGGAQVAASCGQAAQKLQASSDKELSCVQSVAALAGGLHSRSDSNNNAFSFVQKAVHLHPHLVSAWCTLLGAVHAETVVRQSLGSSCRGLEHTAMSLAAHLMAKVESELSQGSGDRRELAALHLWTVKQYIVTLLSLGRTQQAQQFLQQAVWLYETDPVLRSLSASLDQNFRGMRVALNDQQSTPFLWQLLVEGLKGQGLFKEVEKTLKQWLQSASSRPAKLVPLVQLTHLAYSQIIAGKSDDKWRTLLSEASAEALRIDPQCAAVHLLNGMVHLADNNKRPARHSLHQSLDGARAGGLPAARTAARKHLLYYYREKGEEDRVKGLVEDAKENGDKDFMAFYNQSKKGHDAKDS